MLDTCGHLRYSTHMPTDQAANPLHIRFPASIDAALRKRVTELNDANKAADGFGTITLTDVVVKAVEKYLFPPIDVKPSKPRSR